MQAAVMAALPLMLAACFGGPTPAPEPPAPAEPAQVAAPTATPVPPPLPTPAPPLPASPPAPPPPTPIPPTPEPAASFDPALPETLFLEIVEPEDESVVQDGTLVVVGRTTPDALVSVGELAAEVNSQGDFVALVTLEAGANVIEVVASDLTGTQESELLAVIYIP